jgi:hypothetical protein
MNKIEVDHAPNHPNTHGVGMKRLGFSQRLSSVLPILTLIVALTTATALGANGKISGRVVDRETREPIPGANIMITHLILSDGREAPFDHPVGAGSDPAGYYFILNIPPGTYIVKASVIGYGPVVQKGVRVDLDRTITVDFEMTTSAVEIEGVVVTARRETIKPDVAGTQEVIMTSRLEQMPVNRLDEFVSRVKGVQLVSGADGNGLSVRGGSIRETDVRIDGISLQDPRSENSYLALNSTTIEEIQILTGGFQAKYGGIRSGLLNVVTKDGHRDRYTIALKADVAPAQKKYFGTNPWSDDSWIYKVFAGPYAFSGVPTGDTTVPVELRAFRGWASRFTRPAGLDSNQKLALWKAQHPQYNFANKPDMFFEGSLTGPLPGAGIPIFGDYAERTTFLLGFKYEDSQLAFPVGPRNDYLDWNAQLKLTSQLGDNTKLSVNGLYAKVQTASGGQTTSYGGALVDQSSSFGFLNGTGSSVARQASLLSGDNIWQIFNKSRLQYYDQQYFVGGAKLTHTLSANAFYTLDLQVGYTDERLRPFSFTPTSADSITFIGTNGTPQVFLNGPTLGSPNASTNFGYDALNMFALYGGLQRVDSSNSLVGQFKGDLTAQLGRHHQVEAGFSARIERIFVYTGTWLQSQISYTPDLWQYYTATPLEMGLYLQDKLEFEGMILNAGVRVDYLNPMKEGFDASIPVDEDYRKLYNSVYQNLGGTWGGYDRWLLFRDMLDNPPGFPRTQNRVQVYASPRLGVSFPITESSKLYFNYGHFYQRPAISFMYDMTVDQAGVTVPTPNLTMGRTVSYEFGYEQMFFNDLLFNVTAYYKDIRNEPLSRQFINYYHDDMVTAYFPDAYRDVRGVELRLERPVGSWVTFNGMFDYMLQSAGQSGLARVYENRLEAKDELRSANLTTTDPLPRANMNLNIHTPNDFGPEIAGMRVLNGIYLNFFFEWRYGGRLLWNPQEPDVKNRIYVDVVDYWNIDFRGSKAFSIGPTNFELVVTVKNVTNNKWLVPGNMLRTQYDDYKASLRFPFQGGSDKWGQWKSDDGHIKVGWWDAPIFLNPMQVLVGLRLNL